MVVVVVMEEKEEGAVASGYRDDGVGRAERDWSTDSG
jgi:hypothetical protein